MAPRSIIAPKRSELESQIKQIGKDLTEMKGDLKEMRNDISGLRENAVATNSHVAGLIGPPPVEERMKVMLEARLEVTASKDSLHILQLELEKKIIEVSGKTVSTEMFTKRNEDTDLRLKKIERIIYAVTGGLAVLQFVLKYSH